MNDPAAQVAAIFEEWLAERYPGTRWVAYVKRTDGDESEVTR